LRNQARLLAAIEDFQRFLLAYPATHSLLNIVLGMGAKHETGLQGFVTVLFKPSLLHPTDAVGHSNFLF
jgi:hypothetical protein